MPTDSYNEADPALNDPAGEEDEKDESTDEEELSEQLYDNGCLYEQADSAGITVKSAHRLVVALQQVASHLYSLILHLVPLGFTCFGLVLFHCYLFRPFPPTAISSHWIALRVLTSTNFKAFVCIAGLVLLFAKLATAFATQAAAARALMEAEFQSAAWQIVLKSEIARVRLRLLPVKMTYMISTKWAHAFLHAKKAALVISVLAMVLCHAAYRMATGNQMLDSTFLQNIFGLFLIFLLLCLFSADILNVDWGCVTAACLLHYMLHLVYSFLIDGSHAWKWTACSFLVVRDALDFVPRFNLDRINWLTGNTGSGTDFISYLITIILDSIIIGTLHEVNLVPSAVRFLGVFGGNFLGLTGVEALAALSTAVMPLPCALVLVFPYLRRMSQSELVFVYCVIMNCSHASSDRTFIYFGEDREHLLLIVVFLRQFCIVGSIIVCKILHPARIRRYISCAGYQYPCENTTVSSFGRRLISGGLEGLKLGIVVSKVVIVSCLSSVILIHLSDVLLYYLSSLMRCSLTTQDILKLSFLPWLFPFSDSQDRLGYLSHQLVESLTIKNVNKRVYLTEILRFLLVKRRYHQNATVGGMTNIANTDMLTAKYFYDDVSPALQYSAQQTMTPLFGLYMSDHSENLVEHGFLMSIFFYHCLKGSELSTQGLISKVLLASAANILMNTLIMWHAIPY